MTNKYDISETMDDILSSFVSQLGLQSTVLGRVVLVSPWGLVQDKFPEMMFHILLRGECYLGMGKSGKRLRKLEPGDFVLLPRGASHSLVSDLSAKVIPSDRVCYTTTNKHGDRFQKGTGKKAEFICGSFKLAGPNASLLINSLPELVEFRAKGRERNRWIRSTLELLAYEVSSRSPGSTRLIKQLLDTLFVQILRFCSTNVANRNKGLFAAMQDPAMMRVICKISDQYERPWTIDRLAKETGFSRTSLAVKFQCTFGEGVATFLRNHRISCGRSLLEESKLSIKEIANRTGFNSSEVFIRNFERTYGVTPRKYRSQGCQVSDQ